VGPTLRLYPRTCRQADGWEHANNSAWCTWEEHHYKHSKQTSTVVGLHCSLSFFLPPAISSHPTDQHPVCTRCSVPGCSTLVSTNISRLGISGSPGSTQCATLVTPLLHPPDQVTQLPEVLQLAAQLVKGRPAGAAPDVGLKGGGAGGGRAGHTTKSQYQRAELRACLHRKARRSTNIWSKVKDGARARMAAAAVRSTDARKEPAAVDKHTQTRVAISAGMLAAGKCKLHPVCLPTCTLFLTFMTPWRGCHTHSLTPRVKSSPPSRASSPSKARPALLRASMGGAHWLRP
jgi:hypothetical protein